MVVTLRGHVQSLRLYGTRGVPNTPAFRTAAIVDRVSPTPLGSIHSTQDEFVPLSEFQKVFDAAKAPKRLWIVKASDHRFSDHLPEFDRRLLEAVAWIAQSAAR